MLRGLPWPNQAWTSWRADSRPSPGRWLLGSPSLTAGQAPTSEQCQGLSWVWGRGLQVHLLRKTPVLSGDAVPLVPCSVHTHTATGKVVLPFVVSCVCLSTLRPAPGAQREPYPRGRCGLAPRPIRGTGPLPRERVSRECPPALRWPPARPPHTASDERVGRAYPARQGFPSLGDPTVCCAGRKDTVPS